jgi:hypothetical protein
MQTETTRESLLEQLAHQIALVRDAKVCNLPELYQQRRAKLRQIRRQLNELDNARSRPNETRPTLPQ